jgi:MoxR-like ATPase
MFNLILDYPSFDEELDVIKRTTSGTSQEVQKVLNAEEILYYQQLLRKIPVAQNVMEYAVTLVARTRPHTATAHDWANQYLNWGAGPRASQYLIIGAKTHAAISGKYSPDIEDVKAVALPVLRHRIVRNYKAEAERIGVDDIINNLLK